VPFCELIRRFLALRSGTFRAQRARFEQLPVAQQPQMMMIVCSV
jgi:hypothetical protein